MRFALLFLVACLCITLHAPVLVSVVLTGTRVIYPAAASGKTLQLSNADAHPWLVQMWLDAGTVDSAPDMLNPEVPFVLSPPIFRVEPESGQAVRLMLTGDQALPDDRESLFYLNFTQIPALSPDELDDNRLVLALKSRVKVFYRPRRLPEPNPRKLACGLRFHVGEGSVQVENPSAFHAVIRSVEGVLDGREVSLLEGEMLAPFSQQSWPLEGAITPAANAQVRVSLVNDYGADASYLCPWR